MRRTGLEIDQAGVRQTRENASYALPLVAAARVANHFTRRTVLDKRTLIHLPGWYRLRGLALERLGRTRLFGAAPSPERLLGGAIVEHIQAHHAESNRRLAAMRPALALDRPGYPLAATRDGRAMPVPTRGGRLRLRLIRAAAAIAALIAGLIGSIEMLGA